MARLRQAFTRGARAAVRLLHARHADRRARSRAPQGWSVARRDPHRDERQSLPLHRLHGHRRCHRARDGGTPSSPSPRASSARGTGRAATAPSRRLPLTLALSPRSVGRDDARGDHGSGQPPGSARHPARRVDRSSGGLRRPSARAIARPARPHAPARAGRVRRSASRSASWRRRAARPASPRASSCPTRARRCGSSCRMWRRSHAACPASPSTARRSATRSSGRLEAKIGPIAASFAGEGTLRQFPAEYRQVIEGRGGDRRSGSRASGSVDYRLTALAGEAGREATRVDVVIGYALTGPLAQIGRSGLVRDLVRRIGEAFAQNLDAQLRDPTVGHAAGAARRAVAAAASRRRPCARSFCPPWRTAGLIARPIALASRSLMRGSGHGRVRASNRCDLADMRLLLVPLLLALAVVLTVVLLASPPTAGGTVGAATQHRDRTN